MKLRFELAGPLDNDADVATVARIVGGVEDGWHAWIEPDPADPRLEAYYAQNPLHRDLIAKSYTDALAYGSLRTRTVTILVHSGAGEPMGVDRLKLSDALSFLSQKLEVLVENERNDGTFFLAVFEAVAPDLAVRFRAERPNVGFSQGGGKAEVLQLLHHRLRGDRRAQVRPRLFVLVDSDAKFPGHRTSETRRLLEFCMASDIPCAVLEKRAIENYASDDQLTRYAIDHPDLGPSVKFLLSLTSEQRDYFPIKQGIKVEGGKPVEVSQQEVELYGSVTWPANHRPKLPRLMEHLLGQSPITTRHHLAQRNADRELAQLASRIIEEI